MTIPIISDKTLNQLRFDLHGMKTLLRCFAVQEGYLNPKWRLSRMGLSRECRGFVRKVSQCLAEGSATVMAFAIRNCLGVDIGSSTIRIVSMEMGKAGPRIVSMLERPTKIDPAQSEDKRFAEIGRQIQEMLKQSKIGTRSAVFCVPGQSVFVRRIKLPKTSAERMERMIRFEARQQIPFPLEKTIVEYQIFEEGDSSEVNVLLTAIKRETILEFMKMVRKTGLRALAISVSSIALYNFHELNTSSRDLLSALSPPTKEKAPIKPKASSKKKKKGEPEPEAVIEEEVDEMADLFGASTAEALEEIHAYVNLGASLIDLAIPKPGASCMLGFARSMPLAGNEMDRVIADRLGGIPVEEARHLKETQARVLSATAAIESHDGENEEMNAAVTAVVDRIISELRRSLDFYISQPDGVAVDSIVISGGLSQLKDLTSYIEEKIGLPVQVAELRHQQLRLPDTSQPFYTFVTAIGLALQGLRLAQNNINFLPEEIKNVQKLLERPYELIAVAGLLVAGIGLTLNVGANYTQQFEHEAQEYRSLANSVGEISKRVSIIESRDAKLEEAYGKLAKAGSVRDYWLSFMNILTEQLPAGVVLDDVQMRADGIVVVIGKALNMSSVASFVDDLKAAGPDIKSVEILGVDPATTDPRFPERVHRYTLIIRTWTRQGRVRTIGTNPVDPAAQQQQQMGGRRANTTR